MVKHGNLKRARQEFATKTRNMESVVCGWRAMTGQRQVGQGAMRPNSTIMFFIDFDLAYSPRKNIAFLQLCMSYGRVCCTLNMKF